MIYQFHIFGSYFFWLLNDHFIVGNLYCLLCIYSFFFLLLSGFFQVLILPLYHLSYPHMREAITKYFEYLSVDVSPLLLETVANDKIK